MEDIAVLRVTVYEPILSGKYSSSRFSAFIDMLRRTILSSGMVFLCLLLYMSFGKYVYTLTSFASVYLLAFKLHPSAFY